MLSMFVGAEGTGNRSTALDTARPVVAVVVYFFSAQGAGACSKNLASFGLLNDERSNCTGKHDGESPRA